MIKTMIVKAYSCTCDSCGNEIMVIADNLQEARQELKAEGWIPAKFRHCYCSQKCHINNTIRREYANK